MIVSPDSSMHNSPQLPESTTNITDFTIRIGHREPVLNLGKDCYSFLTLVFT